MSRDILRSWSFLPTQRPQNGLVGDFHPFAKILRRRPRPVCLGGGDDVHCGRAPAFDKQPRTKSPDDQPHCEGQSEMTVRKRLRLTETELRVIL